jgi:hypothetical protein
MTSNKNTPSKDTEKLGFNVAQKATKTPEEEFGFSLDDIQGEMGISGTLTHLPKSLVDAFAAKGYDLQYVNYANMAEWNRWSALTKGAVRPVTAAEINSVCGDSERFGLVMQKTEFGGKVQSGVVRAGEMVLVMVPLAVSSLKRKELDDKNANSRKQIYGSSKARAANRFVREDIVAGDGSKVVQTVVRGQAADPFAGKDYMGANNFGD